MSSSSLTRRKFLQALTLLGGSQLLIIPQAQALFESQGRWYERMQPAMGSFVSLAIYADTQSKAEELITNCFDYIHARIAEISPWDPNSAASKLNRQRTLPLNQVPDSLKELINKAQSVYNFTQGSFNYLSNPLTKLWRQAQLAASLPDKIEIKKALNEIKNSSCQVKSGVLEITGDGELEFGGIGKGYIADCAVNFLQKSGVKFARVACSGDLRFLGEKETKWQVQIRDPRSEEMLTTKTLFGSVAVSTSGDYENAWFVNGRRYHHLIDLKTGWPGHRAEQVTVVAERGVYADGLATGVFLEPEINKLIRKNLKVIDVLVIKDGMVIG